MITLSSETGSSATFKYSIPLITIFKIKIPKATVLTLFIYYLYIHLTAVSSHSEHLQIFIFKVLAAELPTLYCIPTIKAGDWS